MPETWNDQKTPALAIVAQGNQIHERPNNTFVVESQSTDGKCYCVDPEGECECQHHREVGRHCIHILATQYYLEVQRETENGTVTEKVPVSKDRAWSAYNKAQATEIEAFDELLDALTDRIPHEEPTGRGRPPIPDRDLAFAAIQKVYSQLSLRRAQTLFGRAANDGHMDKSIHYNRVSDFLNRDDATPILRDLLRLSALPVADLETEFAVDSTGFTTSDRGRHCENKHRAKDVDTEQKWLKLHAASGVNTNIITDARVTKSTGKGTGDVTSFEPLIRGTDEAGFTVEQVSADKAYSARNSHDVVAEMGGEAFIPFKSNATGNARGSPAWKKAYHFFQMHEDQFEQVYHKRSNVETSFGAVKQKFGESLKSRNHRAQVNELLCMLIAYNITVLIRLVFEAGLEPVFLSRKRGDRED